jgi:lysophospholipase L1-like esterase
MISQPPALGGNRFYGDAIPTVLLGDSITAQNFTQKTPTSVTAVGTVVTVNQTNHGLAVGQQGTVQMCTQTEYNGPWLVASVPDKDHYTVNVPVAPSVSPATGSPQITLPYSLSNNGYFGWMCGSTLSLTFNAGVSGDTPEGIYPRLNRDVYSKNPAVVVLLCGINSLRTGGETDTQTFAAIKKVADDIVGRGIKLILCTILPLGSGDAFFNTVVGGLTTPQRIRSVNRQLKAYAYTTNGIYLADTYQAIIDPTSATGAARSTYTYDNLHPSPIGAYSMAIEISSAAARIGASRIALISSTAESIALDANSKNMINNPLFYAGSGYNVGPGVTEGSGVGTSVAGSWRAAVGGTATAVATLVPRTVATDGDTFGNNQVLTITSAANGDSGTLITNITFANQIAAGDVVHGELELTVSSMVNLKSIAVVMSATVGGVQYQWYWNVDSSSAVLPTAFKVTIKTQKFVIPAGTVTAFFLSTVASFSGVGGGAMQDARTAFYKD